MFNKIFVEHDYKSSDVLKEVLKISPDSQVQFIDKVDDFFGRKKKPYLQKRDNLNLFLGKKRGKIVKEAPEAYGLSGEPHYYYVHSYNCIYECEYCYLQGYFHSPDIVLFLNYEEMALEIENKIVEHLKINPNKNIWFHAGEFSDSLALSHLTSEYFTIYEVFKKYPQAKLELRTKSVNLKQILKLPPLENIVVSFSISPDHRIKAIEHKTPRLNQRLLAMKKLDELGYKVAIHLDPIIYDPHFPQSYLALINELGVHISLSKIEYVSLGVVRFTKDVYFHVEKNYPQSDLLAQEFIKSFDDKVRYIRPQRMWMLNQVKQMLIDSGINQSKVYLCMEDN